MDASGDEWSLGAEPSDAARPVERPAYSGERARAAALDLALLTVLWAVVVYFASRAAHVELTGLRPAWPYLAGYLAFLGLIYAGLLHRHHRPDPGQDRGRPARRRRRRAASRIRARLRPRRPRQRRRPRRGRRPHPDAARSRAPRAPRPRVPHARRQGLDHTD